MFYGTFVSAHTHTRTYDEEEIEKTTRCETISKYHCKRWYWTLYSQPCSRNILWFGVGRLHVLLSTQTLSYLLSIRYRQYRQSAQVMKTKKKKKKTILDTIPTKNVLNLDRWRTNLIWNIHIYACIRNNTTRQVTFTEKKKYPNTQWFEIKKNKK